MFIALFHYYKLVTQSLKAVVAGDDNVDDDNVDVAADADSDEDVRNNDIIPTIDQVSVKPSLAFPKVRRTSTLFVLTPFCCL